MAAGKKYLDGDAAAYAKARGVSLRTAQRRLAAGEVPGAHKVNGRWHVPLSTSDYAKAHGVSRRTAQRRPGVVVRSLEDPQLLDRLPDLRDYKGTYIPDSWLKRSPDQIFRYNIHLAVTFIDTSGNRQVRTVAFPSDVKKPIKDMIAETYAFMADQYEVDEIVRIDFLRGYRRS